METVLAFLALLLPLALSPGPATITLAGLGMSQGVARSLPFFCGLLLAVAMIGTAGGYGLNELFLRHDAVRETVRWAGIAYIVYLGCKFVLARPDAVEVTTDRAGLLDGVMLNALNPKFYVLITVLFGQFLGEGGDRLWAVLGGLLAVSVFAQSLWLAAGASLRGLIRSPRARRVQGLVSGCALFAVAAWIALGAA